VVRKLLEAPDDALDERLAAVRDAAYRKAYWAVITPALILALLLVFLVTPGGQVEVVVETVTHWPHSKRSSSTPT
jgi:uncharacterized integral membrane protein